jgi:hypothetical protein|tara:strand:- start:500 stop:724 length:225 start_codon:yes stop_codon:yes gene_type:complete
MIGFGGINLGTGKMAGTTGGPVSTEGALTLALPACTIGVIAGAVALIRSTLSPETGGSVSAMIEKWNKLELSRE